MTVEVLCPICGGRTHLNRDTGDFTCDNCGKIVVRASVNNWVTSVFDAPKNYNESFILEAVSKDMKKLIDGMTQRGWTVTLNKGGHYKAVWPHAPIGQQIIFFPSSPSDINGQKNRDALIRRMEKQFPPPSDDTNANVDNDDDDDSNPVTASLELGDPHCSECYDKIPFSFTQKGPRGNIYNIMSELKSTLAKHEAEKLMPEFFNEITSADSYEDALNVIRHYPLLRVKEL